MSAKIVKVYREHFPRSRFIGKCYTEKDRQNGGFGHKWGEWFQKAWFQKIEGLNSLPQNEGAYLGFMRVHNNEFEYWIGMMFEENTQVPSEFDFVDLGEFDVATFWLYGNEDSGELYGAEPHNMCLDEIPKHGFTATKGWYDCVNEKPQVTPGATENRCMERYNCPRFTSPDEKGNVILDYCISIENE